MNYKKREHSITTSKHNQLDRRLNNLNLNITQRELILFKQQKLKKDIRFFDATSKYLSYFTIVISGFIVSIFIYDKVFVKNNRQSLSVKLRNTLLDIEEESR